MDNTPDKVDPSELMTLPEAAKYVLEKRVSSVVQQALLHGHAPGYLENGKKLPLRKVKQRIAAGQFVGVKPEEINPILIYNGLPEWVPGKSDEETK